MKNTPIWMEKASKAYISYNNKEWNDNDFPMFLKGLVVFDTTNDLVATESSLKTFSLCIFNAGRPIHFTNEFIDNNVLMMLSKKIGRPSMLTNEHSILTHNWALEQFTSEESTFSKAHSSMDDAHMFGDPILRDPHAGNIFFSSTETED